MFINKRLTSITVQQILASLPRQNSFTLMTSPASHELILRDDSRPLPSRSRPQPSAPLATRSNPNFSSLRPRPTVPSVAGGFAQLPDQQLPDPHLSSPLNSHRSAITESPPPSLPPSPINPLPDAEAEAEPRGPEVIFVDAPTRNETQGGLIAVTPHLMNSLNSTGVVGNNRDMIQQIQQVLSSQSTTSPVIKRRRKTVVESVEKRIPEPLKLPPTQEEGNCCSICLEPWSNSGLHHICATKCGHLFGYHCIKEWLTGGGRGSRRSCPSCKTPCRVKDLRYLFGLPSHFSTSDASEAESLRKQLEEEREAHRIANAKLRKKQETIVKLRASMREISSKASVPGVRTFGETPRTPDQLKFLASHDALLDSQALTFDAEARLIFPERVSRAGGTRYILRRLNAGRSMAPTTSPSTFAKKVTDLNVCADPNSSNYRYISASLQSRSIQILTPELQPATSFHIPGVPSSCCWLSSNPHALSVGLISGGVCTYDLRYASNGPLYQVNIDSGGWRLVHSLAEIRIGLLNGTGTALLAGAPKGLYAACLDGSEPRFQRVPGVDADRVCGVTVSGSVMAITLRQGNDELLAVHRGLRKGETGLELGEMIGTPRQGLSFDFSRFIQPGIVSGEADGRDTIVVCPDAFASSGVGCWGYARKDDGGLAWRSLNVEGDSIGQADPASVRGAVGFKMPPNSRIDSLPTNCKSMFGCYTDERIRLYTCGQHGTRLQT